MDTILMAITALSVAMSVGMAIVVITLLRRDRARSEARVALLAAMSADPVSSRRDASPFARAVEPMLSYQPRTERLLQDDLDLRVPDRAVTGVSELFARDEPHAPWGRRAVAAGALASVLLAIGFVAASQSRPADPATNRSAELAPESSVHPQRSAPGAVPLELLSLHHVQEAERLVITGVVQNPRTGAPLSRIAAAALLFGPDGTFLTSGRAPLDFTTLTPGVESPFVVTVPVTGTVARYRIGFRTGDGRVIAHVDRRPPDALAQK
jgi:hypothetical protein